jgi:hypothetical protein
VSFCSAPAWLLVGCRCMALASGAARWAYYSVPWDTRVSWSCQNLKLIF